MHCMYSVRVVIFVERNRREQSWRKKIRIAPWKYNTEDGAAESFTSVAGACVCLHMKKKAEQKKKRRPQDHKNRSQESERHGHLDRGCPIKACMLLSGRRQRGKAREQHAVSRFVPFLPIAPPHSPFPISHLARLTRRAFLRARSCCIIK